MASATSASAVAPAAPKVAGTKKKVVGKSPTTQKQKLKDMTADKYKKSITLTDRGAQVMDQALSAFVSELTNHACELKDHAGRVKLDVPNVFGALQAHFPSLLCGKEPKDAQVLLYADKRVAALRSVKTGKRDERMEIDGTFGAQEGEGEAEDDDDDEQLPVQDGDEEDDADEEEQEEAGAAAEEEEEAE